MLEDNHPLWRIPRFVVHEQLAKAEPITINERDYPRKPTIST